MGNDVRGREKRFTIVDVSKEKWRAIENMACMCITFPRFVKAMRPLKFNECETNKKIFVRCQVLFGRKKTRCT